MQLSTPRPYFNRESQQCTTPTCHVVHLTADSIVEGGHEAHIPARLYVCMMVVVGVLNNVQLQLQYHWHTNKMIHALILQGGHGSQIGRQIVGGARKI